MIHEKNAPRHVTRGVAFDLHATSPSVPVLTAGEFRVDIGRTHQHAGRHALQNLDERRAM